MYQYSIKETFTVYSRKSGTREKTIFLHRYLKPEELQAILDKEGEKVLYEVARGKYIVKLLPAPLILENPDWLHATRRTTGLLYPGRITINRVKLKHKV